MKINLILAAGDRDPLRKHDPFMPLSLPILASSAPNHDYTFTDLLWEDSDKIDYDADFDLIGISFRVSATDKAFEIADKFRAKGKTVVLGGAQASSIPLRAKKHADVVVIGEGEVLWPVVLNDFQNNSLKDFYVCSPKANLDLEGFSVYRLDKLPELSGLPIPAREMFKRKYTFDMVFAARGCPVNCSFCAVSDIFGTKMRFKEHSMVLDEINNFGRRFFLIDDTVFGRNDSYEYYLELYKKLQMLPKRRFWIGQANLDASANNRGQEVIKQASLSGLSYVSIGLETINPQNMKETGIIPKMGITDKDNPLAEIKKNIEFIQKQGIGISGWFTIGLEHDTLESCKQTIDFCLETNIFPVFTPIQALEGTRYYTELKEKSLLLDQKLNVSNVKNNALENHAYIDILQEVIDRAYSSREIWKRTWFHLKIIYKTKKGLFNLIHRIILLHITQVKLRKISKQELVRFKSRIQ
jgi:radical SAM superfamily enzyme YgiQ (UPF0313 family)